MAGDETEATKRLPREFFESHLETIAKRELFRTFLLPRLGLTEFAEEPDGSQ